MKSYPCSFREVRIDDHCESGGMNFGIRVIHLLPLNRGEINSVAFLSFISVEVREGEVEGVGDGWNE